MAVAPLLLALSPAPRRTGRLHLRRTLRRLGVDPGNLGPELIDEIVGRALDYTGGIPRRWPWTRGLALADVLEDDAARIANYLLTPLGDDFSPPRDNRLYWSLHERGLTGGRP